MTKAHPVSMQLIEATLESQSLPWERSEEREWRAINTVCALVCSLNDPSTLHLKGQSLRRFSGSAVVSKLADFVTNSNRVRAFPKAYIEPAAKSGDYTLSAEVNRLISAGMSDPQLMLIVEHIYAIIAFFQDFERTASRSPSDWRNA